MTEPAIDTGEILEALNDKTDRDCRNVDTASGADADIEYQIPTAENNYTWYRLYKSGWVEQGGLKTASGSSGTATVSLLKQMSTTNYNILITTQQESTVGNGGGSVKQATLSVSSFDYGWASIALTGFYWKVEGMSAQS